MRKIDRDSIPHLVTCAIYVVQKRWYTLVGRLNAYWWAIGVGPGASFIGCAKFKRHPRSKITIAANCQFLSSHASNLIGVNRPCMISTLSEGAELDIGANCGFSGTVIGCGTRISIGDNVMCGANTLITDTDWHLDDPRTSPNVPVIIENGVWLGINVTVLKGVTIGANTLVGAGSLVTRSLPPNVIASGCPAKVIAQI